MQDAEILKLIQEALFEVAPTRQEEFAELTLESAIEDLALDSIALMEMIGFIEDRLEIVFDEEELQTVQDIAALARLIRGSQTVA